MPRPLFFHGLPCPKNKKEWRNVRPVLLACMAFARQSFQRDRCICTLCTLAQNRQKCKKKCVSQKLLYYFAWSFSRSFWTLFPCENSGKQEPTQLRGKGTEGRFVGEGEKKNWQGKIETKMQTMMFFLHSAFVVRK